MAASLYIGSVMTAGSVLAVLLAPRELDNPVVAAGLLAATLLLSIFKIRLPLGNNGVSSMSMAYVVDFIALLVEGANLAMLLGAAGALVQCTVGVRRKQPIHRAAFSAAAVIMAVQAAGMGWRALDGSLATLTVSSSLLPLMVCALTYYIVNTSLVVGAIAVTSSVSPARTWSREFLWSAPAYLVAAVIASLVALAILHGVLAVVPLVAAPLYVCYRGYHGRWSRLAQEAPAAEAQVA
jgi:hypothetical protein